MLQDDDIKVLRQYVTDIWVAHQREHELEQKALELARSTAQRELETSTKELSTRLLSMNEFREQLTKQAATFVTRDEWQTNYNNLDNKYDTRFRGIEKLVYIGMGGVMLAGILINIIMYVFGVKAKP